MRHAIHNYLTNIYTLRLLRSIFYRYISGYRKLGYMGNNVLLNPPIVFGIPKNVYLYDNVNICSDSIVVSAGGKFIMKENSGAARGLTVITGNHMPKVGVCFKDLAFAHIGDIEKDVIVEEDVWIGANVTLLAGVTIGRGAIIGAGSVCRNSIPPYSIVFGNPAKVVGFKFTPEEILAHENILYSESERCSIALLKENYSRYFLNRRADIANFIKS